MACCCEHDNEPHVSEDSAVLGCDVGLDCLTVKLKTDVATLRTAYNRTPTDSFLSQKARVLDQLNCCHTPASTLSPAQVDNHRYSTFLSAFVHNKSWGISALKLLLSSNESEWSVMLWKQKQHLKVLVRDTLERKLKHKRDTYTLPGIFYAF